MADRGLESRMHLSGDLGLRVASWAAASAVVCPLLLVVLLALFAFGFAGVVQRALLLHVDPMVAPALAKVFSVASSEEQPAVSGFDDGQSAVAELGGEGDDVSNERLTTFTQIITGLPVAVEEAVQSHEGVSGGSGGEASGSDDAQGGSAEEDDGASDNVSDEGSIEQQPSMPAISDAQEAQYLAAVQSYYDKLPGYYSDIDTGWNNFVADAHDSTEDSRVRNLDYYSDVAYRVAVDQVALTDVQVPSESRHHDSFEGVLELYGYLGNASALLRQAWARCCWNFSDESDWMTPYNTYSSGGRITFLTDYEARYAQLRPR
ncbi:MAG: hypothetical protein U0L71_01825 [Eggerthellaceae bacterium]|nr:hypothetical protein [Eggerthellaceae bacterium]